MTFWGSTAVGIDRLAAFRDVDVLCSITATSVKCRR